MLMNKPFLFYVKLNLLSIKVQVLEEETTTSAVTNFL